MNLQQIQTDPRVLSTMLSVQDPHRHMWSGKDLNEMLHHQLAAQLPLSLGVLSGEAITRLREAEPPLKDSLTLSELLGLTQPPLELLQLIKRFAKICREDPNHALPEEIVSVLYYASITAAFVRLGETISTLDGKTLIGGIAWLLEQPWLTDDMRKLLVEGRASFMAVEALVKPEGGPASS